MYLASHNEVRTSANAKAKQKVTTMVLINAVSRYLVDPLPRATPVVVETVLVSRSIGRQRARNLSTAQAEEQSYATCPPADVADFLDADVVLLWKSTGVFQTQGNTKASDHRQPVVKT